MGKLKILEKNCHLGVIVKQSDFPIRVPSSNFHVEIRGDEGIRGEIKVGNRERVDSELGKAGAENQPDDEEDGSQDDDAGDYESEYAAKEGGAADGVGIRLVVSWSGVVLLVVVSSRWWRSVGVGGVGRRWWVAIGGRSWVAGDGSVVWVSHGRSGGA